MPISTIYAVAADQIKNGDIIHMFRPKVKFTYKSFVYAIIEFFTNSPIYHNVVAMWMITPTGKKELMCVESSIHGGKRIVPLSIYSDRVLEVQPLPDQYKFADMEEVMLKKVGQQAYSLLDFISIGLREYFGIRSQNFPGQVCSEFCASAWITAGVPLKETLVSPGMLKKNIEDLGILCTLKTDLT